MDAIAAGRRGGKAEAMPHLSTEVLNTCYPHIAVFASAPHTVCYSADTKESRRLWDLWCALPPLLCYSVAPRDTSASGPQQVLDNNTYERRSQAQGTGKAMEVEPACALQPGSLAPTSTDAAALPAGPAEGPAKQELSEAALAAGDEEELARSKVRKRVRFEEDRAQHGGHEGSSEARCTSERARAPIIFSGALQAEQTAMACCNFSLKGQ